MDTNPALLLLLTLAFCCPGIRGQSLWIKVRSPKDMAQLQVGQRLQLECHMDRNSGASWIRQDKAGSLHFIVFISTTSRATFEGNQRESTRFEARRQHLVYHLVVKYFTPRDEGKYFCVTNFNQMLYFSPGQSAFIPATTTVALTIGDPTTKSATTEDLSLKTPGPDSRMQEAVDHFCLVFLWMPLSGLCLLLLQLLATTIVLHRCKAQH